MTLRLPDHICVLIEVAWTPSSSSRPLFPLLFRYRLMSVPSDCMHNRDPPRYCGTAEICLAVPVKSRPVSGWMSGGQSLASDSSSTGYSYSMQAIMIESPSSSSTFICRHALPPPPLPAFDNRETPCHSSTSFHPS